MPHVVYEIIEHDGGWAYRMGSTISETFASHAAAHSAAESVAREQRAPGESTPIQYETSAGEWKEENSRGADRPETEVED